MEVNIEVFILFDREDRELFLELKKHLASLENEGLITVWDEDQIAAGTDWRQAINLHLRNASLILLLVSAHFMASESYTLARTCLAKHDRPEGSVIPVLLHAADWEHSDFGSLKPLPDNRKPISSWSNRHVAYLDVVKGIREVVEVYEQSTAKKTELSNTSLVTITTPDGKQYKAEVSPDMLVSQLLRHILSQWLPITLGTTGSQHFSLRPVFLDQKGTLHKASLAANTNLELVSESLGPNELVNLRLEGKQGNAYTITVPLNTVVGQLTHDFLGTTSGIGEAVVEWMLSATSAKPLRLEASLYYQGVCDDALLRIYRIAIAAEE